MPSATFHSKRHDTAVSLPLTFTPPAGLDWDLTEPGMVVTLIARNPQSETPKVNAPAVVTGAWSIRYDPAPADVDTAARYDVEAEAVRANGRKLTLPTKGYLSWTIEPDLDNE